MLNILLLGTVEVYERERRLNLGRKRERALFSLLALSMNHTMTLDRLAALLWDDSPPASYRDAMYVHIARLRTQLDPGGIGQYGVRLVSHRHGYSAEGDPSMVDACRFQTEVKTAMSTVDAGERALRLNSALRMWRGPLLTNALSESARDRVGMQFIEARRAALESYYQAKIDQGAGGEIIGSLAADAIELWPNETLTGQLMRALHAAGRRTEALEVYQRHRIRLSSEYGLEPGPDLRRIQTEILQAENTGPPADERPREQARPHSPPRHLPPIDRHFVGRTVELVQLDEVLDQVVLQATAANTAVVCGPAGVGKTAFALRWAHGAAKRFPDGQLFLDLRGFSPHETPMTSAQALRILLEALGVPAGEVPLDPDAAAGRYRSALADRAVLVVLDNVATIKQVRPLLASGPRCLTIVTSRHALSGLVAREGAFWLTLPCLDAAEAMLILRATLPAGDRGDDAVVATIARACGYLPLALRIAAAKVSSLPALTTAAIAAELTDGDPIRVLALPDDDDTTIRTTFAASYATLPPPVRRVFRLLGIAPGTTFTTAAVAALAATSEPLSELETLGLQHLLESRGTGRWSMHDLIRLYAARQSQAEDGPVDGAEAIGRLMDYYLAQADAATALINPNRRRPAGIPSTPYLADLTDHTGALTWLEAEYANLMAVIERAAAEDRHDVTWRLAQAMWPYFHVRGLLADWTDSHRLAVAAARATGDLTGEAECLHNLGTAFWFSGRYEDAANHYHQALVLRRQLRDRDAMATTLGNLGVVAYLNGSFRQARTHLNRALALRRREHTHFGEATLLNSLSAVNHRLGANEVALEQLWQARCSFRLAGNRHAEAATVANLATVYGSARRFADQRRYGELARVMMRDLGDVPGEAAQVAGLSHTAARLNEPDQARTLAQEAERMLVGLDNPVSRLTIIGELAGTDELLGQYQPALDRYQAMLALATASGGRYDQARAHHGIARMLDAVGRSHEADDFWRSAVALFDETGAAEHAAVRAAFDNRS